jgi:hypothetical protein
MPGTFSNSFGRRMRRTRRTSETNGRARCRSVRPDPISITYVPCTGHASPQSRFLKSSAASTLRGSHCDQRGEGQLFGRCKRLDDLPREASGLHVCQRHLSRPLGVARHLLPIPGLDRERAQSSSVTANGLTSVPCRLVGGCELQT